MPVVAGPGQPLGGQAATLRSGAGLQEVEQAEPDRLLQLVVAVVLAATSCVSPVWFVNVTPVAAVHAAPAFEVMAPLPVTVVTRTWNGFGFVTRRTTLPFAPG